MEPIFHQLFDYIANKYNHYFDQKVVNLKIKINYFIYYQINNFFIFSNIRIREQY